MLIVLHRTSDTFAAPYSRLGHESRDELSLATLSIVNSPARSVQKSRDRAKVARGE